MKKQKVADRTKLCMNEFKHSICDLISTMASVKHYIHFPLLFKFCPQPSFFNIQREIKKCVCSILPTHVDTELEKAGEKKSYSDTLKDRQVSERKVSRSLGLAKLGDEGKH